MAGGTHRPENTPVAIGSFADSPVSQQRKPGCLHFVAEHDFAYLRLGCYCEGMQLKSFIAALAVFVLSFPLGAFAQERDGKEHSAEPSQSAPSQSAPSQAAPSQNVRSQFVGRYDGSSMETAMGMVVREDGTFQWGLSVGSLDLRAKGTWMERGGAIIFASDPKPVAPQFIWDAVEPTKDGPFLRIEWADSGKPFSFADVRGLCANGELVMMPVMDGTWSPGEDCDKVTMIELYLRSYQVLSGPFELEGERAVEDGETIRFVFHRNDLGVADFDGVTGFLEDGTLRMDSSLGPITLRKIAPSPE